VLVALRPWRFKSSPGHHLEKADCDRPFLFPDSFSNSSRILLSYLQMVVFAKKDAKSTHGRPGTLPNAPRFGRGIEIGVFGIKYAKSEYYVGE
jgi:hypothetical protein